MTLEVLQAAINTFGLPIALLLFMTYQDQQRKKQDMKERIENNARIQALEDYQKGSLAQIAIESATALQNISEANKESSMANREIANSMKQLSLSLRTRPCLANAIDEINRQRDAG